MNNEIPKLIFIGGCPRSGTTLVQNILDSHSDIVGGPEFLHLRDVIRLRKQLKQSVDKKWIDLFCSHESIDAQLSQLIKDFLLPLAQQNNAKFLSEKTPENVLVFSELAEMFPTTKMIHVIRDPRAIVASLLSVGQRARGKGQTPAPFTRNASAAINYVRRCFEAGFLAEKQYPEQIYPLIYENLVTQPEKETEKLCAFLGIEMQPAMLQPGNVSHLGQQAITNNSNEIWYDAKTYSSNPNTSSVEKWKKDLSPEGQYSTTVAFQNHPDLSRHGYTVNLNQLNENNLKKGRNAHQLTRGKQKIKGLLKRVLS